MAWVITKDYSTQPGDGLPSRVGRGQWGDEGEHSDKCPQLDLRFRLRYEDKEDGIAYSGRYDAAAVADDIDELELWGALTNAWKWGMWDVGATELEVQVEEYIAALDVAPEYADKYIRPHADKDGWYVPYS